MSSIDNTLAKVLAVIFLLILLFLNSAATMWFVFGLYPKSWLVYMGFTLISVLITVIMQAIK